jgi:hypothetical protein
VKVFVHSSLSGLVQLTDFLSLLLALADLLDSRSKNGVLNLIRGEAENKAEHFEQNCCRVGSEIFVAKEINRMFLCQADPDVVKISPTGNLLLHHPLPYFFVLNVNFCVQRLTLRLPDPHVEKRGHNIKWVPHATYSFVSGEELIFANRVVALHKPNVVVINALSCKPDVLQLVGKPDFRQIVRTCEHACDLLKQLAEKRIA